MQPNETRELISKLSETVWELVCELESAQDVLDAGRYKEEMALYDRALAWLIINPEK